MKTCWQKDQPGASPGLRPGDEVTIPAGLGWPVGRRQTTDRTETVVAVNGPMAVTAEGTFFPMYNPAFAATGQRREGAEISPARRRFLSEQGWEVLGGHTPGIVPQD